VAPDYWYFDTEAGGAFGFNTETGIGANLPQMESLCRMIASDKLWPLSEDWNYHCTASSSVMNNMDYLMEALTAQYGAPKDLDDFVRKAHALDYAGTRGMFEAFRARMPEATGIVQWMLNSAWPSIYWQLYDWYGVPTAAYYGVKTACAPEQLVFNYKDRKVYLVNECMKCGDMTAYVQVFDADSRVIGQEYKSVMARYHTVVPVFDLKKYDGKPHYIALMLTAADGKVVANNFYWIGASDNAYDFGKTTWYYTPVRKWSDLSFVFAHPEADVAMTVEATEDGYDVTLENRKETIVPQIVLKALDKDGNLAVPVYWSENFCPLLPNGTKTFHCRTEQKDLHFVISI
jgi:exo-1,4-beta-D-glucosaminidase